MKSSIDVVLPRVLAHEGGYVNDKDDPGGPTNKGITQAVYDGYRDRKGLARRSVRAITSEEVGEIYKRQYWDAVRADDLPTGLDYAVFDFAVNSGVSRAARSLQKILGVKVDGVIGEKTLAAINGCDVIQLLEEYVADRMMFLRQIKKGGGWRKYGKGWTRRVMGEQEGAQEGDTGVIDIAILMIHGEAVPIPLKAAGGKSMENDRESVTQSTTLQATLIDVAAKGGAGIAALQALDDKTVQLAVIGLLAVALLASAVVFRERLRAWAEGWR